MSNPIRPTTGTPEYWLRHAKSDLAVAQSIENNSDVLPNQTAFHAQQAAEKAIKGAMIHAGIAFPLMHDLQDLIKRWTSSGRAAQSNCLPCPASSGKGHQRSDDSRGHKAV